MTSASEHVDASARLSEDEANRILARAIELDSELGARMTVAQLRAIADEVGIAPEAVEQALSETASVPPTAAPSRSTRISIGLILAVGRRRKIWGIDRERRRA